MHGTLNALVNNSLECVSYHEYIHYIFILFGAYCLLRTESGARDYHEYSSRL